MDGAEGQVSERMAPRGPENTKNTRALSAEWADRRTGGACDGAVLLLVDRNGTYTMGSLDVQGCDDVPILWLPAKSNERSYEQRSQVWARNYNNKGDSSRASCATVPILVLDCFTSCLCSSRGLPRPPTNAYTVVIGSEAEQRRFNAG